MNVMILGSGGREHALAWKISQSKRLKNLFVAPGNAGTKKVAHNIDIKINDFDAIGNFCLVNHVDMLIVGPEEPLVKGIKDYFQTTGSLSKVSVIGPDRVGALLEGSKAFAKQFMKKYGIPTARYLPVTKETIGEGLGFLETLSPPFVLKADGLAAGKGVVIVDDQKEAEKELKSMLDGKFGDASCRVVIEEFLSGIELSVFVITDGKNWLLLPEAKDYKRIGENDTGPNTGGMGSVSPVPFAGKEFMKKVVTRIIQPTIKGLQDEKIDYRGFIFFGLINVEGNPFVIEYNVRLGDPETEAIMPRIKNDLLEIFSDIENQNLKKHSIEIDERVVTSIMLVSGGYPGDYKKGIEISGLDQSAGHDPKNPVAGHSIVFHAGTKERKGGVVTNGGRVLAVSSPGENMEQALERCYHTAEIIKFEGMYYRKDIGKDLI
jgi:phosphoribosylamine---glycine ligase